MKRVVPFIFPLIALAIVLALLLRWYSLRTNNGQITPASQNIEVNEVSEADQDRLARGAQDLKSIDLNPTAAATESAQPTQGKVRYEELDGKLNFSIAANLPELKTGVYQVWLRSNGQVTKAMVLELGKGGWIASGSVNSDHLPLEILVSREVNNDGTMEVIVLSGQIEAGE